MLRTRKKKGKYFMYLLLRNESEQNQVLAIQPLLTIAQISEKTGYEETRNIKCAKLFENWNPQNIS